MRTHTPIDLVTELIRSPEPATRGNATVALGTLGTAESTAMLAEVALTEKDPGVRTRAQQELRLLGSKSESGLKNVTAAIHDRLRDRETRVAAYALLGHLRSQGLPIPIPKMTIAERVRLAARSRAGETQTSYYRAVAMGSILASAAMLLFSVFVVPGLNTGELSILLFFASCLAPIFTMFVFSRLWRWKPVSVETDFLGAILVDSRLGLMAGSFLGILIAVVASLLGRSDSWKFVWVPIVSSIALLPAVRLGTAVAFGTFKPRAVDIAYGRLAGAASGIAVITLLQLAFRSYKDPLAAAGWLALTPISVALATAITTVDHQEEAPQKPVFGRGASFAAGGVSLAVLACAILAGWHSPAKQCDAPVKPAATTSTDSFPLTPGRSLACTVHISQPSQVTAKLSKEAVGNFRIYWQDRNVIPTIGDNLIGLFLTTGTPQFTVQGTTGSATPGSVLISAGHALSQNFKQILRLEPAGENSYPLVEIDISAVSPEMSVNGSPAALNNWCWSQSVRAYASEAGVRQACQDAVTRSGNNVSFLDSRGLNRALNGDYAGAIDDFSAFVAAWRGDPIKVAERRKWIAQLQKHQNPFTPAELNRIASE